MGGFTNPTIGDAVLAQFGAEIDQLSQELHHLENAKGGALAGQKDYALVRRIDTKVGKIGRDFEWHRETFQLLFAGADQADARIVRLRTAISQLAKRIGDLLATGQPDRGKGSVARIVQQHRDKLLKTVKTVGAPGAPIQPTIQMPGLPSEVSADPVLALAILIDVLRQVVLGKNKKK